MNHYYDNIKQAANLVRAADCVLVGVGSGATAAGGLCYTDPALAEKWYPEYFAMGKKSIIDIMSGFWATTINSSNATAFWGFWAKHIYHIRYEPSTLQPYSDLRRIVEGKRLFFCSTNVDGQLEKAGFDTDTIFAPQGDYALFQCVKPCSQEVYNNKELIGTMLANMVSPFEIHEADIPLCPRCGKYLMPNLRCDYNFVEIPHIQNAKRYEYFLHDALGKRLILLELGVGFNTPGIIRFPFEKITASYPHTTLIRINLSNADVSKGIAEKAISINEDVGKALSDILLCS
jgi:NAD-dependent SIR2 family protein deacetylase